MNEEEVHSNHPYTKDIIIFTFSKLFFAIQLKKNQMKRDEPTKQISIQLEFYVLTEIGTVSLSVFVCFLKRN
ncbi:hypothetical protein DERP_003544 [Dermatophagoides pteronyssinus]|uniref:Uncharacterized protein n=1 Tax=Dermatophagoides pteronyssinus TaxID=6956 RepID=A0ABQ8JLS7_DERPT|nr:hypothetical protein DERP_003544 [Dermatophagoides pteronyssinus]